jgi:hypothetical protein
MSNDAVLQIPEAIAILRRTPPLLSAWLSDLPEEWTSCNTGPETFSPYDIVGHLIHGERTDWMVRLRHILTHGPATPFASFDRFAMYRESQGKTLAMLLDEFAELRAANLAALADMRLSPADLSAPGRHPALGPVTVGQLIATWAVHDLNHIAQIARTTAFRCRDAVGPWREYLSILPRG